MTIDPFEGLIKNSQRGSPKVQTKDSQPSEDPFKSLIKQDNQENKNQPSHEKKNFSWFEKHFTKEGQQAQVAQRRNFVKSILSGSTAGLSEYFDPLKVDYEGEESSVGYMTGALVPIGLTFKGIGLGFNVLKNLYNFGPKAKIGLELAHQALTGATYGTEKQLANVVKGGEFDVIAPAIEGVEFAAASALIHGLVKYSPPVKNWLKSLTSNQAEELIQGTLPKNLTPNQYEFWEKEVAPDWLEQTEKKYKDAMVKANEQADAKFSQDKSIAKAKHERDLYEAEQSNQMAKNKYGESVGEYERDLQKVMDEHELAQKDINQQNQMALEEFEEAKNNFHEMQARQAAVANATRLRPGEENLPYRPSRNNIENPSLENEVGNIISPNEVVNSTNAGKANIEAVRANDQMDYRIVNDAYSISEELGSQVETVHPNLAIDLQKRIKDLHSRAILSPPEQQVLTSAVNLLNKIAVIGPEGTIINFNPVKNTLLHEEAKALRYYMDFTFEHGNARGILNPLVQDIQNSTEIAANFVGNNAAVEADQTARTLYREWAQDYDNNFIRKYRDRRNTDFSDTFKNSLHTDEFNALDNILSRSNAGQQLSQSTRRALVEKNLDKFLENPHGTSAKDFETALKELGPVINSEEANAIREVYQKGRKGPEPIKKPPLPPKLKTLETKLPEFNKEKPPEKMVKSAEIAHRKFEETPEVKIASKEMKLPPEEIRKLADTPSGLKKLKENTSKDVFKKIGWQRIREILFEGKINPQITGKKLYEIINKGENYSMLAEIIGKEEAAELLEVSKQLSEKFFTKDNVLKYGKKIALIKSLSSFGII